MKMKDLPTNDVITEWDWDEVFRYAADAWKSTVPSHAVKAQVPVLDDLKRVVTWDGVSPEGYASIDIIALFQMKEKGQYAWLYVWTDTTGWGCQDSVTWVIGTLNELLSYTITRDELDRVSLPREQEVL